MTEDNERAIIPYASLPISQEAVVYAYGPDSAPRPQVRPGQLTQLQLHDSRHFPGTSRRVWIHVPHGHQADEPAGVMFFNDGWWYLDPDGDVRGGIVLDNLAASGEIPPLIGVFVDPGIVEGTGGPRKNRNVEYDAFDSRYADFLLHDVLPRVREQFAVSDDPAQYGICGGSSGGNAALTAAWTRSDTIRRIIAYNASFAQMPGGNPYPRLIQETAPKPIRVLLHAAHRDIGWNRPQHNWFAENLRTAAALAETGYDMRLIVGDGPHKPNHGGVLLPDALRWLWRGARRRGA